jgi:hypothetical protein
MARSLILLVWKAHNCGVETPAASGYFVGFLKPNQQNTSQLRLPL